MTDSDLINETEVVKSACGGLLKDSRRYPSDTFNGTRVYFCTTACRKVFLENPEAFMSGEVEHSLDDEETESL